jgi:hypothetical protein
MARTWRWRRSHTPPWCRMIDRLIETHQQRRFLDRADLERQLREWLPLVAMTAGTRPVVGFGKASLNRRVLVTR